MNGGPVALAAYALAAFVIFVTESALMLGLGAVFMERRSGRWAAELALKGVIAGLMLTGLLLLGTLFVQTMMQFIRRKADLSRKQREERWTEIWLSLIWNEGPNEPILDGRKPTQDPAARDALLSLRENMAGNEGIQASNLYNSSGLLEQDLRELETRSNDRRVSAIERLSLARHPRSLYALERLCRDRDPEIARYALLAMARVSARVRQPGRALVTRFVPRLSRMDLGEGSVQQCLVLLEGNAAPVLENILEPGSHHPRIRAALESLGHIRDISLIDLTLPWLASNDMSVRSSALRAIARIGFVPPEGEDLVRNAMLDPEWPVRAQAVLASVCLTDRASEVRILELLGDPNWWVRHNSGEGHAGRGKRGRALLIQAAELHPDRFARDTARQALLEKGEMSLGAARAIGA
jgi:HEAT repeat protein